MGNDPILSLSQSVVLNLYTMDTIDWYLRKESNLRPLVRSKVFYPLNYAGVLIFSNASLRIRNFLSWIVLLTSRYSMPSITCTALMSLQTTRSPLNLFLNVIAFIAVSLWPALQDSNPRLPVSKTGTLSNWVKDRYLAPEVGIEPTIAESKSVVLPLHYSGSFMVVMEGVELSPGTVWRCCTTVMLHYHIKVHLPESNWWPEHRSSYTPHNGLASAAVYFDMVGAQGIEPWLIG